MTLVHILKPVAYAMTDKSADVRKAAEACFGELVRVCGQERVSKNLNDIQGPALAFVVERLRLYGELQETSDLGRTTSTGTTLKVGSKIGKSTGPADRASRDGNRAGALRVIPARSSRQETLISVQDISIQSQASINVKDSSKGDRENSCAQI